MAGNYTRWYRVGTVNTTLNSTTITGNNTYWLTAGLRPGDLFTTTDGKNFIEISAITDNTHITLATPYPYESSTASNYAICRNFTAHLPSDIAAQTTELVNDMARFWDEDKLTLKGESAYEVAKRLGKTTASESAWIDSLKGDNAYLVAKANGFTGTAAQWLESLKAAGEWSSAQESIAALTTRTEALETLTTNRTISNSALAHRTIYRGKNLGSTITDEQSAAIRNGNFTDIFIGDYWKHSWRGQTITFLIVDIDYYMKNLPHWEHTEHNVFRHHVVVMPLGWHIYDGSYWVENAPYKADGDYSGGYYNSDVRNNTIPILTEEYAAIFGEEHMFYHPDYICNAVNSNGDAGYILVEDSCVEVPSWRMVANRTTSMPEVPNFRYPPTPHVPGRFAAFRVLPFSQIYTTPGGVYFRECRNTSNICVGGYNLSSQSSRSFFRPYFTLY